MIQNASPHLTDLGTSWHILAYLGRHARLLARPATLHRKRNWIATHRSWLLASSNVWKTPVQYLSRRTRKAVDVWECQAAWTVQSSNLGRHAGQSAKKASCHFFFFLRTNQVISFHKFDQILISSHFVSFLLRFKHEFVWTCMFCHVSHAVTYSHLVFVFLRLLKSRSFGSLYMVNIQIDQYTRSVPDVPLRFRMFRCIAEVTMPRLRPWAARPVLSLQLHGAASKILVLRWKALPTHQNWLAKRESRSYLERFAQLCVAWLSAEESCIFSMWDRRWAWAYAVFCDVVCLTSFDSAWCSGKGGYTPNYPEMKCRRGKFFSPSTYICEPDACPLPTVRNRLESGCSGLPHPAVVSSGSSCSTQCSPGYTPSVANLKCFAGKLTPDSQQLIWPFDVFESMIPTFPPNVIVLPTFANYFTFWSWSVLTWSCRSVFVWPWFPSRCISELEWVL